jgi:hypothetical protein
MSSFSLFPTGAVRRPMASVASNSTQVFERLSALPKLAEVTSASRLTVRPTPEMVSSGAREIDALTGGLPRGCLTEVCGSVSSGRTSLLLTVLAAATQRQEACALVDVSDAFDPVSAATAAVNFESLLWVRCGVHEKNRRKREEHDFSRADRASFETRALAPEDKKRKAFEAPLEQALRVTDLLLQSGGFGLVLIDLCDVPLKMASRIPLTSWFRFQRAIEHTPTVLFVITSAPCAQTCAALLLKLSAFSYQLSAQTPSHAALLNDLEIEAEILRSRMSRKPAQSITASFLTKTVCTG